MCSKLTKNKPSHHQIILMSLRLEELLLMQNLPKTFFHHCIVQTQYLFDFVLFVLNPTFWLVVCSQATECPAPSVALTTSTKWCSVAGTTTQKKDPSSARSTENWAESRSEPGLDRVHWVKYRWHHHIGANRKKTSSADLPQSQV